MTPGELRVIEAEYCREHIDYFFKTYVHIERKDTDASVETFDLWPMQESALESIHNHRLNIVLKARQLGISWLGIGYVAYTIGLHEGRMAVCLSRSEEGAKELIRRLVVVFRSMPELIAENGYECAGWTGPVFKWTTLELTVSFPSGFQSTCKAFPSSPNAPRAFTADLLFLDEWAFQQFAEDIWKAAYPIINSPFGGKVIGVSTIERGTLFETLFTDEDNGFNKIFLPWYSDPTRDDKWYEDTKKALGEAATLQEYPATIEEALTIPGGAFFPEVKKSTHIATVPLEGPLRKYTCIDYGLDMFSVHWIAVDQYNRARVYKEYDSPNILIAQAAEILKNMSKDDDVEMHLAPPDLWSRSQETGKSRADIFADNGITLVKTSNDLLSGCSAMKEWLSVDAATKQAYLMINEGAAPNLFNCLQKIQRDKNKPNIYSKEPHGLTHDVDSLRCFCVWWTSPADTSHEMKRAEWPSDLYEDYENADDEGRAYLINKYGNPF